MKKAQKTRLLRVGSLAMAAALLTACGSGTSSSSSAAASESAPALLIWNGSSALRGMATLGAKASFLKTSPKRRA